MTNKISPTGNEVFFDERDIIVSKTDLKGRVTYANRTFMNIAGYSEKEILGKPHSIIRHPGVPRAVFKLLWDSLANKEEVFAYVVNMAKNGDHYWVLAHVTPSINSTGDIIGYHSSRRVPDASIVSNTIAPLYKDLLSIEKSVTNKKEGMNKAFDHLINTLKENKVSYNELILSL
ncbi:MAG: PAS domain S-box protein [bacterium]|nr:PAS domain S-box protein [bacterium]